MSKDVDIVICISVYALPEFLENQLKTISENVKCSYVVVLSCNDYMFNELSNKTLPNNVVINPEIINKTWYTGTVLQGIVSNMNYASKMFTFKYSVILSARTIFYKNMMLSDLDILSKKFNSIEEHAKYKGPFPFMDWHWPSLKQTLLAKYYLALGYKLQASEHEGLVFSYNVTQNILSFLNKNTIISKNLFEFKHVVEEFALQTISCIEVDASNLEYGFFTIGHGVTEICDYNMPHKYTRKIAFRL